MATSTTEERPQKRTAVPTNIPTRSPYDGVPNPVQAAGDAVSKMANQVSQAVPRAPDGSLSGPGLTPYAPYRMGPQRQPEAPTAAPVAQAVSRTPAAAVMAAPPAASPSVGTMPMAPDVQGANVNPLAKISAPNVDTSNFMPGTRAVMSASGKTMADLRQSGSYGALAGEALRATTALVPAIASDIVNPLAPVTQGVVNAGRQFLGLNDGAQPAQASADGARAPGAPGSAASKNPAANQGGPSSPPQAAAPATPATPATPSAPAAETGGIRRIDRPGQSPMFTNVPGETGQGGGAVSAQNMNAANVLASRLSPSMPAQPAPQQFAAPASNRMDPWTARNEMRNAETQASSIDRRTSAIGKARMAQLQESQLAAMREDGAGQRAAMDQNGGLARESLQQGGANARAVLEGGLKQQALDAEGVRNGFANRAASRLEQAQTAYLEAKTPEEQSSALKRLQALDGKQQTNKFTVVPGGSAVDPATGLAVQRPSMVLDNSTGRLVDLSGQGEGGQAPAQGAQGAAEPPPDAVTFLRDKGANDPAIVEAFDAKYGKGAAARYLR